ncbi:thioester domain-containing protein [Streptomyces sp. NPDC048696]|uniref:thioester domain-containing protein n=1 Tax=Streptomyces sp. NPDC048696 TaxID=3365585 RepID=UPI003715BF75
MPTRTALRARTRPAVAITAFAVLVASAPAAQAADPSAGRQTAATATLRGLRRGAFDRAVIHGRDRNAVVPAGLLLMDIDGGGTLETYGIDLRDSTRTGARYRESATGATPLTTNPDAGRIRWLAQNSFPQTGDLTELARRAGLTSPLSAAQAAAGTQVAIWRLANHVEVDATDPQADRFADWLRDQAQSVDEPSDPLSLDNATVSGRPGERLGPVVVRTAPGGRVTVTPSGELTGQNVTVVDAAGHQVSGDVGDGSTLFFEVPSAASDSGGTVTFRTTAPGLVGRVFTSEGSQSQIAAGASEFTTTAQATVSWAASGPAPAPSPSPSPTASAGAANGCAGAGAPGCPTPGADKGSAGRGLGSAVTRDAFVQTALSRTNSLIGGAVFVLMGAMVFVLRRLRLR